MMLRVATGTALLLAVGVCSLAAQRASSFHPDLRRYVAVDAPVVALTNATLIDGTGAAPRSGQTIVISGNRIQAVGPTGSVAVPAGAHVVDASGHTVIPGLMGMHDHMFYTTQGGMVQSPYSFPRLYLGTGVTTVRTTGSFAPYAELNLKNNIERHQMPGPRIHITGPYLISQGNDLRLDQMGMHKIETEAAARRVVRHWAEEGAEWIKGYTQLSRDIFRAVIDEAHKHGMKVTGHLCSISFTEAVELGIDNIEHGFRTNSDYDTAKKPDECPASHFETLGKLDMKDPRIAKTFKAMIDNNVPMTTTSVNEQLAPNRPGPDARVLAVMAPWIAEQELDRRKRLDASVPGSEIYPRMREIYPRSLEYELAFVRAGGVLAAGVDPAFGAVAGYGNLRVLELLREAGFTTPEAVQVLTLNGAVVLGVQKDRGSVEAGKLADLVLLRGNLANDPKVIYETVTVFKDGIGYDSAKLIADVKGQVGIR